MNKTRHVSTLSAILLEGLLRNYLCPRTVKNENHINFRPNIHDYIVWNENVGVENSELSWIRLEKFKTADKSANHARKTKDTRKMRLDAKRNSVKARNVFGFELCNFRDGAKQTRKCYKSSA